VSELSGPLQSTIDPSEYVCRTLKSYVLLEFGLARKWNAESSPVGVFPPVQVTFWTIASSPEPFDWPMRFHPGAGTKESIAKPDGTVSSTDVVVRFAFSVGTSRPNSWRCFESTTVGLISACAQATLVKTSAATVARAPVTRRRFMCIVPSGRAAATAAAEVRPEARPVDHGRGRDL